LCAGGQFCCKGMAAWILLAACRCSVWRLTLLRPALGLCHHLHTCHLACINNCTPCGCGLYAQHAMGVRLDTYTHTLQQWSVQHNAAQTDSYWWLQVVLLLYAARQAGLVVGGASQTLGMSMQTSKDASSSVCCAGGCSFCRPDELNACLRRVAGLFGSFVCRVHQRLLMTAPTFRGDCAASAAHLTS
jgi:hypothetical protein